MSSTRPLPRAAALFAASALLALSANAPAAERVQVLASFSILADMIERVGGEHVEVTALVGPDSDAHVFTPRPTDARALAEADLVVFNGLQFEGWMARLTGASDYAGPTVVATDGIEAALAADDDAHGHDDGAHDAASHDQNHGAHGDEAHEDEHGHDEHDAHRDEHHDHDHGGRDPHAWQDLGLGSLYVINIRDGLISADPDHADVYRERAARYLEEIAAMDAEIQALVDALPEDTSVITGHDSFGHFARAYGVSFLSPVGLSSEAEPSAANMARLIDVIRERNVEALFHENMTSPAMIDQLAEETGLPVAGTLYADALAAEGEASTWLGMMRHNARLLHDALADADDGPDEHGHQEEAAHEEASHDEAHGHDH
ncbi:metal ABC transporter solute-binding protein, Zn/Mn family [Halomonas stenophila]|uniref:Zinc/manganese transport system substrate-binding protein n=1 Tax=Halomonas stenophila TaxID=795312 RepID=A0A7W5HKR1_9GAMM|nr:zinc ABC transporter substrate-binding protein [Halomonas stenophila]MBB3230771.1 zinc/manganese transport system substrate-binding protein [Halomonas stenophila]